MTRYSASRGIIYTAPPTAEESDVDVGADAEAEESEPSPADD